MVLERRDGAADLVLEGRADLPAVLSDRGRDRVDLEVGGRGERGLGDDLLLGPGARPAKEHVGAAGVLEHLDTDVLRLTGLERDRLTGLLLVPVRFPVVDHRPVADPDPEAVVAGRVEGVVAARGGLDTAGPAGGGVFGAARQGLERRCQTREFDLRVEGESPEVGEVARAGRGHAEVLALEAVHLVGGRGGGHGVGRGVGGRRARREAGRRQQQGDREQQRAEQGRERSGGRAAGFRLMEVLDVLARTGAEGVRPGYYNVGKCPQRNDSTTARRVSRVRTQGVRGTGVRIDRP